MRANEFITEEEVKPYEFEKLQIQKAVNLLREHCSEAFEMIDFPIWRGMRNHTQDILYIDISTGKRQSQNTSNHYTELMDNSPYMKGWPKRSKSLIGSTNSVRANVYGGEMYAIFPFNGAKIAVCPNDDIWVTPVSIPELDLNIISKYGMDTFNGVVWKLGLTDNYAAMINEVKTPWFAQNLRNYCKEHKIQQVRPDQFIPLLQKALSPAMTGFRLMSIPQFVAAKPKNKEVWVSGKVIAIRKDLFEKFYNYAKYTQDGDEK